MDESPRWVIKRLLSTAIASITTEPPKISASLQCPESHRSLTHPDYIKSPEFRRYESTGYARSSSDRTLSPGQRRPQDNIDVQADDDAGRISLKIHAIQTGTVRVKDCQRVGRGRGFMRQVNILLDRSWTESLPIYAWAIETPDGVVMVDTGETARTGESGYFPRWHPYFRTGSFSLTCNAERRSRPATAETWHQPRRRKDCHPHPFAH